MAFHKKSRKKFKNTVKEILDRRCSLGLEKCKSKLRKFITGWANYFKYGLSKSERLELDQWIRRRIRQMYWKIWKTPGTRIRALVKFGIPKDLAYQWGNSSKAYWRIAGFKVLSISLTGKRLESQGGWVWLEDCCSW
ncbi:group II intron maturase-specific domain-containing protein [Turicimonas muris]|uniref:group II intron maturase-specific domain-containing protein n=1 Tax=Turicimonas muris TaxID=1796652 RepID=UPI003CD0D033